MDRPLFIHGPLCDPDLLAVILGRTPPAALRLTASAPGFAALECRGGRRAALVRAPGEAAEGRILLGLSAFERDLLDALLAEEFRPAILPVMIGEELHEADAYLPRAAPAATSAPWSILRWQENHKATALVADAAAASTMRARLIAIRPN